MQDPAARFATGSQTWRSAHLRWAKPVHWMYSEVVSDGSLMFKGRVLAAVGRRQSWCSAVHMQVSCSACHGSWSVPVPQRLCTAPRLQMPADCALALLCLLHDWLPPAVRVSCTVALVLGSRALLCDECEENDRTVDLICRQFTSNVVLKRFSNDRLSFGTQTASINGSCAWWGGQDMGAGVRCAARVKERMWVGLACGGVHVFACGTAPRLLAHWAAHDCAVIGIVQVCRPPRAGPVTCCARFEISPCGCSSSLSWTGCSLYCTRLSVSCG